MTVSLKDIPPAEMIRKAIADKEQQDAAEFAEEFYILNMGHCVHALKDIIACPSQKDAKRKVVEIELLEPSMTGRPHQRFTEDLISVDYPRFNALVDAKLQLIRNQLSNKGYETGFKVANSSSNLKERILNLLIKF